MRNRWILILVVINLTGGTIWSQEPQGGANAFSWSGEGMSEALPSLVEIAMLTRHFLVLEDDLELDPQQRKQLTEINFSSELALIRQSALFAAADSSLKLVLSQAEVDMSAVEEALRRKADVRWQVDRMKIQHALEAIAVLSHRQHIRVLAAVRGIAGARLPAAADPIRRDGTLP